MELFKYIISISSLLGCLGVCISVIIGPILLPPKYQAALVIIPYLAIGLIFGSFASLYGLILEKNYRLNIRLYSMILGATVNFLLSCNRQLTAGFVPPLPKFGTVFFSIITV